MAGFSNREHMCIFLATFLIGLAVLAHINDIPSRMLSLHQSFAKGRQPQGELSKASMVLAHGKNKTSKLRPKLKAEAPNKTVFEFISNGDCKPPGCKVQVASEDCASFEGFGFLCFIEAPEHALVHRWLPTDATVMEFGARFGSTTCEIASKLDNSGRVVSVEPDSQVWGWLESNLKKHNCHAYMLRGAIGTKPITVLGSGYGGQSAPAETAGARIVPTVRISDIERTSGLKFDTFLIDCEGCAQYMMDELGWFIKHQIKLILLEADMPNTGGDCQTHCMDYHKFFSFLESSGFEKIDQFNDCDTGRTKAPPGTWCGSWIEHYAYRRKHSPSADSHHQSLVTLPAPSLPTPAKALSKEVFDFISNGDCKAPSCKVQVAAEDCASFVGVGFICFIEAPEHELVHKWLPTDATVMEFGARFGSTTCEIAKKLDNSGRLVSVEPDSQVWGWLESNLKKHNCHAHMLRGAIGRKPITVLGSGYGGRSAPAEASGASAVPTVRISDIEIASGLKFDTFLIDCEGCAQDIMDELGWFIKNQIKLILLEADMPNTGGDCQTHCMDYQKFFSFLESSGFEKIDQFNDCDTGRTKAPPGTWCGAFIEHYAFRRKL